MKKTETKPTSWEEIIINTQHEAEVIKLLNSKELKYYHVSNIGSRNNRNNQIRKYAVAMKDGQSIVPEIIILINKLINQRK